MKDTFRIGVISGKLGGVDGVSLEVDKWNAILAEQGHTIYTIAGKYVGPLDHVPPENQLVYEDIQFGSPEQEYYEKLVFPHLHRNPPHIDDTRKSEIAAHLEMEGEQVAGRLFEMIQAYDIDVIVAENTNAMPMSLLGGMGVYKLATARRMATIFHHHDFWWERSRFSHNHIEQLLSRIMPPTDPGIEHIVLSIYAAHILSSLKRVQPTVIPNCEDFDHTIEKDDYNGDLKSSLGFREDDFMILQPTRIVRRKHIEDSVRLVGRLIETYPDLADRVRFVISLYQGDEPDEDYVEQIVQLAKELGFEVYLISERVSSRRGIDKDGRKLYTNRDVLANADLVTYLPVWEGFGNAFLEAVAAKVPVVITTYLVYKTDIKIMGFKNIEILDHYDEHGRLIIPDKPLEEINTILRNDEAREKMVRTNIEVGQKYFGYNALRRMIRSVFDDYGDEIRASRRRIRKSKTRYSV